MSLREVSNFVEGQAYVVKKPFYVHDFTGQSRFLEPGEKFLVARRREEFDGQAHSYIQIVISIWGQMYQTYRLYDHAFVEPLT